MGGTLPATQLIIPRGDAYNGGKCRGIRKANICVGGGGHCHRPVVQFWESGERRFCVGIVNVRVFCVCQNCVK